MNEGEVATRLGLARHPAAAETIMLERDIRLVELTGGRYHAGQISCPRLARHHPRRQGERPARHLRRFDQSSHAERERHRPLPHLLQDEAAAPLEDDRRAMVEGVASGDIDVIVSPRSAGRRWQAPALRRGRRRRGRARNPARRRSAPLPQRRGRAAPSA